LSVVLVHAVMATMRVQEKFAHVWLRQSVAHRSTHILLRRTVFAQSMTHHVVMASVMSSQSVVITATTAIAVAESHSAQSVHSVLSAQSVHSAMRVDITV
jgi:hypothetical protein